jgi:hypothetical protein
VPPSDHVAGLVGVLLLLLLKTLREQHHSGSEWLVRYSLRA